MKKIFSIHKDCVNTKSGASARLLRRALRHLIGTKAAVLLMLFILAVSSPIGALFTIYPAYASTIYGDTTIEAYGISVFANSIQAANKFTTSSPIIIQSFSLYFAETYSHNLKFAVYPDSGGSPVGTTLVKQTNGYYVSGTGWITVTLNSSDYIYLPAGTYWMCFTSDAGAGTIRRGESVVDYYISNYQYSSGFPTTFNGTSEIEGPYSFYVTAVAATPVGGVITPTDNLSLLAPYVASALIVGLVGGIIVAVHVKRRGKG